MHIVILGGDGRAYALGKRFVGEGHEVTFIPGNSACRWLGRTLDIPIMQISSVVNELAVNRSVDLVVSTTLDFSERGVVDSIHGVPVYGVSAKGVTLEAHRGLASNLCKNAGIATPEGHTVTVDEAIRIVEEKNMPFVVKWDCLVGGTNVSVCESVEDTMFELQRRVTPEVTLQERLYGVEVSFTVTVGDNGEAIGICTVFEHKRAYDNDLGPMTAEMGSLVLAGVSDKGMELYKKLQPVLNIIGYRGMLDINCMLNEETGELWFIEFTARFGDPTTEIWVPMIKDELATLMLEWAQGNLVKPSFTHACGIGVVVAGGGYPFPGQVKQGLPIQFATELQEKGVTGLDWLDFMSAHVDDKENVFSNGGRQFVVTGYGNTVSEARLKAYGRLDGIRLRDMYYRTDIGAKWVTEKHACIEHGVVQRGMGGFDLWGLR